MGQTGNELGELLIGMSAMGYAVAGLYFLRFYRQTRDRLFAIFCTAFWMLGVQAIILGLSTGDTEDVTYLFVIRLCAFLLLLYGIVDKNYLQPRRKAK